MPALAVEIGASVQQGLDAFFEFIPNRKGEDRAQDQAEQARGQGGAGGAGGGLDAAGGPTGR